MLWYIKLYIFTANPNIYRVLSDHIAIPTPRMLTIAAGQSKKISSPWWQLFLLGHKKTEGFFNHETFQVKSGSGSWFKGSEDQPFSQGTRMQAKKISNFTDFTWEQIQIQNLQTLRGSNITHEKTWMKVGQTCKTRICQSLLSASKSHSRHLFVESMSGPWPYRWDFNRLPVLNWSYRILARLSWSCLFWWGPSCNWSHILLQVSPTRTPSITPGSLFFTLYRRARISRKLQQIAANTARLLRDWNKSGLNGLPFIALNINFWIKTSVGHTDSLLSQVIPSSSVTWI